MFFSDQFKSVKTNIDFYKRIGLSKLIISDGMPRSGSTLIFNIIKLILLSDKCYKVSYGWIKDLHTLDRGNIYLIKTQGIDWWKVLRAHKVFYSYRDIRNILISRYRMFGKKPSIEMVRKYIQHFKYMESKADLMLRYEDIVNDLYDTVKRIAKYLEINVVINDILNELPSASDHQGFNYSKETLLHPNHRTGTVDGEWRTLLPSTLQNQINTEFDWWFKANNYPIK